MMESSGIRKLKGGPELLKVLDQFPEDLERNVLRGALRAGAKPIQEQAKENVRRRSGKLAKAIVVGSRVEEGQPRGYVRLRGSHSFIGLFLEFGVKWHLIKVSEKDRSRLGKKTRHGFKRDSLRILSRKVSAGSLKIGKDFVGPVVEHPGFASKPFLRPALDRAASAAIKAVGDYIFRRVQIGDIKAPRLDVEETE